VNSAGRGAVAVGEGSRGTASTAVAVGSYAWATHSGSVALGANAATTAADQIMLGSASHKVVVNNDPAAAMEVATKRYTDTKWTMWTGTQAAYDAIGTKDANCLYVIV